MKNNNSYILPGLEIIKRLFYVYILIIFVFFCTFISSPTAAQSLKDCTAAKLRDRGVTFNDCGGTTSQCSAGPSDRVSNGGAASGSVFVIGDSLTMGAVMSGDLLGKLDTTAGLTLSTDYTRSGSGNSPRISGTSVEATQGIGVSGTITNLAKHASDYATVDNILIALGTNPESNYAAKVGTLVSKIRETNTKARIFWVDTYYSGSSVPYTTINEGISQAAETDKTITVIKYGAAAKADESLQPDGGDGVHMSGNGYKKKADFIVSQLASTSSQPNQPSDSGTSVRPSDAGAALTNTEITVYSPQEGGDVVEGGYASARPGKDGLSEVRTLDDVAAGTAEYVTLAGDPSLYNKQYTIPTITYTSHADGTAKQVTLTNVTAFVHDTGSAFIGKPEGRFDVAVGKDYTDSQMNSQTFVNNIQFIPSTGEVTTDSTTEGCSQGTMLPGNDNIEKIWNFFVSKGLTPQQIAGFMGNLKAEGGFEPKRVQYGMTNCRGEKSVAGQPSSLCDTLVVDGNTGFGIAQWTSSGRQQNLLNFAASKNTIAGDLSIQLDFLWTELEGSYSGSVLSPLRASTEIRNSTDIVLYNFECPQTCVDAKRNNNKNYGPYQEDLDTRTGFAQDILVTYGSGTTE